MRGRTPLSIFDSIGGKKSQLLLAQKLAALKLPVR
jgi:hypothetical protein